MPDELSLTEQTADSILAALPCSVKLAAGSGKTELLAAVVSRIAARGGRALVLTHTHAGVAALKRRMTKFDVDSSAVAVRTIDSWTFDLIRHYPLLSGLQVPEVPDWRHSPEYHRAGSRAVKSRAIRRMLQVSYDALLVDEYQDCLIDQHHLILGMADAVPTGVFGDPLQGLFNFKANVPVRWDTDVTPQFAGFSAPQHPRRWEAHNPALGTWLLAIRDRLESGLNIDLRGAPVNWVQRTDHNSHVAPCFAAISENESVVVLGRFRRDCVAAASKLGGAYTVMEALDEKVPITVAEAVDVAAGAYAAGAVLEFAVGSTSGLAAHFPADKRKRLAKGGSFESRSPFLQPAYQALRQLREAPSSARALTALAELKHLPNVKVHCREAWDELHAGLDLASVESCSVAEAIQALRSRTRVQGRRSRTRVVSRPLLVKGLEYDHAIILDPSAYSAQELYVALTRGTRSLTVVSARMQLPPAPMAPAR